MIALFTIAAMFIGTIGTSVDVIDNNMQLKNDVVIEYVYKFN